MSEMPDCQQHVPLTFRAACQVHPPALDDPETSKTEVQVHDNFASEGGASMPLPAVKKDGKHHEVSKPPCLKLQIVLILSSSWAKTLHQKQSVFEAQGMM